MKSHRINHTIIFTLVSLTVFLIAIRFMKQQTHTCTIFTAVQGEMVLYGNNEDSHFKNLVIGVNPPTANSYGAIRFGSSRSDGGIVFEGAVNDHGLSWDTNSNPGTKLNPHPDRPYYLGTKNFLTRLTNEVATVEEAIALAKTYSFGNVMESQIHIADRTGDAVAISGGPDGEIAFTRINPADGYLLSTNFNLATQKGPVDFRWDTSSAMLDALNSGTGLTPAYAGEILQAVRLNNVTTYTLYSDVRDLKNNKVYLFYKSQYDEMAEIDMQEEFAKGGRVVDMRDFFSSATVQAGDAAYQRFENKFTVAKVVIIAIGVLFLAGVVVLVVRVIRRLKKKMADS